MAHEDRSAVTNAQRPHEALSLTDDSTFPERLHAMISYCDRVCGEIAKFGDNGKDVVFLNIKALEDRVLSLFFNTANYSSLQRQLQKYGFADRHKAKIYTRADGNFHKNHPEKAGLIRLKGEKDSNETGRKKRGRSNRKEKRTTREKEENPKTGDSKKNQDVKCIGDMATLPTDGIHTKTNGLSSTIKRAPVLQEYQRNEEGANDDDDAISGRAEKRQKIGAFHRGTAGNEEEEGKMTRKEEGAEDLLFLARSSGRLESSATSTGNYAADTKVQPPPVDHQQVSLGGTLTSSLEMRLSNLCGALERRAEHEGQLATQLANLAAQVGSLARAMESLAQSISKDRGGVP